MPENLHPLRIVASLGRNYVLTTCSILQVGRLSFGCSLEQLELLEMLESHIEWLERLEKVARDLVALSKDRKDRERSA
jgi:hypothetical protein